MRPSSVITPLAAFSGRSNAAMMAVRPRDLVLGRGEDVVARGDLGRVDERLAVHAQAAALLALGAESGLVLEVVVDAVEHVEAVGAGREHTGRSHGVTAKRPPSARARVSFSRSLVPSTRQLRRLTGSHAAAAISAALRMAAGVSIIAHSGSRAAPAGLQDLGGRNDVAGARDLGDQDRIGAGGNRRLQIGDAPRRLDGVDPDDHLARP
jgi:hypothetical protein